MNILDLDLDFFVSHPVYDNSILPAYRQEPSVWNVADVHWFLRSCCGLRGLVPGWVIDHHKDVYFIVRDDPLHLGLSHTGHSWVHVDSHSDLGFGASLSYFSDSRSPRVSSEVVIDSNNVLLALVSDGYIAELHNVYNQNSVFDYDVCLFSQAPSRNQFSPAFTDRTVTFHKYIEAEFNWTVGFDLIFLSQSARYSAKNSDSVSKFIRGNYIREFHAAPAPL